MSHEHSQSQHSQNQVFSQRESSRSRSRDKQSKRRKNSAEKLGRPSKKNAGQKIHEQSSQNKEDSYDSAEESLKAYESSLPDDKNRTAFEMMQAVVSFFYEIGQEKGMVFDQIQRKQFRNKAHKDPRNNKIDWTERHEWHPERQLVKLQKVARICGMDLKSEENKYLTETILEVSALYAQQFTEELYIFLLNIWLISKKLPTYEQRKYPEQIYKESGKNEEKMAAEQSDDAEIKESIIKTKLRELADRVQSNYKGWYHCLSFDFKIIKDRNKKNEKDLQPQQRQKAYRKLVDSIYAAFKRM